MHFPVVWLNLYGLHGCFFFWTSRWFFIFEKNQTTAKCKSPFWTTGKYINSCTSRWFMNFPVVSVPNKAPGSALGLKTRSHGAVRPTVYKCRWRWRWRFCFISEPSFLPFAVSDSAWRKLLRAKRRALKSLSTYPLRAMSAQIGTAV